MNCNMVNLFGTVIGNNGAVAGLTIEYTTGCRTFTTQTNDAGVYSIVVQRGCSVLIRPVLGLGISSSPPEICVTNTCNDLSGLDFMLSPIIPMTRTVSGALLGGPADLSGFSLIYTVDGVPYSLMLGADGSFSLTAPTGSQVILIPPSIPGYMVAPANITIPNLMNDLFDQNFVYTAVPTP